MYGSVTYKQLLLFICFTHQFIYFNTFYTIKCYRNSQKSDCFQKGTVGVRTNN